MPSTPKTLFRGAATTTTSTTLYTVPAATTTVVTNIVVVNPTSAVRNFTLSLDDVKLAETVSIGAYDSTVLDIKQALSAADTIKGGASTADVIFHISGVEIS
jgi:hypothetical protein